MNILLSLNCDFCDLYDEDDEKRKKHRRCVILVEKKIKERTNSLAVISSLRDFYRMGFHIYYDNATTLLNLFF